MMIDIPPGSDTREFDLVIRGARVVADDHEGPRAIAISQGMIAAVLPPNADLDAREEITIGADAVILPGLVDSHVHICDPGTDWEGFATATAAAAASGITTLVDMPIDSFPATVDLVSLAAKHRATEGQLHTDVAIWGGLTPGNTDKIDALLDAGVVGFKCFLVDPGSPDFEAVDDDVLTTALAATAQAGVPVMVHAEDFAGAPDPPARSRRYADWLAARPPWTEDRAVKRVIEAARRTGGRAHIAHVSSASSLPLLEEAQAAGVAVTGETCPHYLALCAEEIADGQTAAKCGPPIRDRAHQAALWDGLRAGTLSAVVSDHSPCLPEQKTDDFATAWAGVSSLQIALPVVWTAARARGFALTDLAQWMSTAPAALAGLRDKGRIAVGADADLCVFVPDDTFVVDPSRLLHRHPVSPYTGRELSGAVRATMLRGHWIDQSRSGRLVSREAS
jgi:allantoinase